MDFLVNFIQEGLVLCHSLIESWGLSIVLLTTIIRLVLWPLQAISIREQAKLKKLKPALDQLQLKFKDQPQFLLVARNELMKKAGARPLLSMVSMLLPLPIFIAIYKAIAATAALHSSAFVWIPSLAAADPFFILPALAAILMWLQNRKAAETPQILRYAFPIVAFAFLATMPAGVALYSLTSSVGLYLGQRLV